MFVQPGVVFLTMAALCPGQMIEGTVSSSLGGAPLAGVAVAIRQAHEELYKTTTDAAGTFRIEGVRDGAYTAHFSKRGFQAPPRDSTASKPFRVAAGGAPVHLDARMAPLGQVSGRVLDGDGNPVPGAEVELLFANSFAGQTITAEKDGTYTFKDVEPGTYQLNARPRGKVRPPARIGDQLRGWARTYYPGALDSSGAGRIIVRAGADLPGQDVRLLAVPVHAIRGRVLDPKGEPVGGVAVQLEKPEIMPEVLQAVSRPDGWYEFPNVADGPWQLSAETGKDAGRLRAFLSLMMQGHDSERLDLRLSPAFPLRGHVDFENAGRFSGKPPVVLVLLAPAGGGPMLGRGNTDADGNFEIQEVFEGSYHVSTIGAEGIANYYLASMMLGTREILAQNVEFSAGSPPLRIVYRANGGTVRGTVDDCRGAGIVLVPQDPALQQVTFIRREVCDANGRYEITQVRPGDYYAFAFDEAPVIPDVLVRYVQGLVNQAAKVTVRPGEATGADLKVTEVR